MITLYSAPINPETDEVLNRPETINVAKLAGFLDGMNERESLQERLGVSFATFIDAVNHDPDNWNTAVFDDCDLLITNTADLTHKISVVGFIGVDFEHRGLAGTKDWLKNAFQVDLTYSIYDKGFVIDRDTDPVREHTISLKRRDDTIEAFTGAGSDEKITGDALETVIQSLDAITKLHEQGQ